MRRIFLFLWFVAIPYAGTAQTFERILLPILTEDIAGGYGSVWRSEFWVHNRSDHEAVLMHTDYGCPVPECVNAPVPPHSTVKPAVSVRRPAGAPPGVLIWVDPRYASEFEFNLRIQDVSRQALTWGTEMPVVRLDEFRTGPVVLLNVPLDDRFRQALRIYEPDSLETSQVRVRIFEVTDRSFSGDPGTLLVDEQVRLTSSAREPQTNFTEPGYAEWHDFRSLFPQLAGVERVRVEVEPVTEGLRIWAFVSVTNNETQHVTTITPQ